MTSLWRIVLTTNDQNTELGDWTGVAPVCPRQLEPGGPHDDVLGLVPDGFYEGCCPGLVLECGSRERARNVCKIFNEYMVVDQHRYLDDTPSYP